MNTDGTLNAERFTALLKGVNDAASQLQQSTTAGPLGYSTSTLLNALHKLTVEMTHPTIFFMNLGFGPHLNGVLEVANDLALFDLIPLNSSMTSSDIADKTGADEALIVRLFRCMTSMGIFYETGRRTYAHNKNSEALRRRNVRSMLRHLHHDTVPCSHNLAEFLKKTDYQNPVDAETGPCKMVHGDTFFELTKKFPERGAIFDDAMTSLTQDWNRHSSVYAFEELAAEDGSVALVDVGGGKGHNSEMIRDNYPELKNQKIIVQDLPNVVPTTSKKEDAERMRDNLEYQAYDFFQPQPVKGAKAYYFSHILHDWSDDKCREILKNTIPAMDKDSKILIRDFVLPDVGCPPMLSLLDINMMSISSMERDESDWKKLLDSCGLKWNKLHAEGGKDSIIEAVLV